MCEQLPGDMAMFIVDTSEEGNDSLDKSSLSESSFEISTHSGITLQGQYLNAKISEN